MMTVVVVCVEDCRNRHLAGVVVTTERQLESRGRRTGAAPLQRVEALLLCGASAAAPGRVRAAQPALNPKV